MKRIEVDQFFASLSAKAAEARRPEGVTFELTYGCNFRCVHCYNPTHRVLPDELTTREVVTILDQIADFGMLSVTFTGGEPFIRPDIVEIVRHAHARGLVLQFLTNATRITPSIADFLQEVRVNRINVSIYGATEATYERMTGVRGSYALFHQGLACLISRRLPVTVRMPVTTINHREIEDCRALVEDHGIKFQCCLDIMPKTNGDLSPLRYRLNPEQKVCIDQAMMPHRLNTHDVETCAEDPGFIECACGRSRFAITPYGDMNLCVAFPIPRYSLRTGTVREGWEFLKQTVDHARPNDMYECHTCDVRTHCRQGRSDAWLETGDMSRCLPHFKEFARLEQQAYVLPDSRRPR